MLHFWSPHLDPAHPEDCTQPERYAIQLLGKGTYLAVGPDGEALIEVSSAGRAL